MATNVAKADRVDRLGAGFQQIILVHFFFFTFYHVVGKHQLLKLNGEK